MLKTILVIEDNEQNMYLMNFILEKKGYRVIKAMDGKEGIELAFRDIPDLILLDIQLPHMDGYEVARNLRESEELKKVPIIAVTSYAMVGDKEKSMAAGCTVYKEKPINPGTFVDEIKKYL
jgi:two-component system cell cycle response regulator DivK